MPNHCVVPGCREYGTFSFPSDPAVHLEWRIAINRMEPDGKTLWKPSPHSRVCASHFKPEDFKTPIDSIAHLTGKKPKRMLKEGVVPSIFPLTSARAERQAKRQRMQDVSDEPHVDEEPEPVPVFVPDARSEAGLVADTLPADQPVQQEHGEVFFDNIVDPNVGMDIEISSSETHETCNVAEKKVCPYCTNKFKAKRSFTIHLIDDHDVTEKDAEEYFKNAVSEKDIDQISPESEEGAKNTSENDVSSMPSSDTPIFSLERFKDNAEAVKYYTSFDDYGQFMYVFRCLNLNQAAFHLEYKSQKLDPINEFFLFVVKLRQAKDDFDLGTIFGVSRQVAGRIFFVWLHFVYHQLKEHDLFLDKDVIEATMPVDFKEKFGSTRIVLDATEIKMTKPGKLSEQSSTWSSYKNANTAKTMVGISPKGKICRRETTWKHYFFIMFHQTPYKMCDLSDPVLR